jgi:hypothetical protein
MIKVYKEKYYSVPLGKMACINGRGYNDGWVEAVVPVETVDKIGLEGVACKKLIQCCIENVREGRENVPRDPRHLLFVYTFVCI